MLGDSSVSVDRDWLSATELRNLNSRLLVTSDMTSAYTNHDKFLSTLSIQLPSCQHSSKLPSLNILIPDMIIPGQFWPSVENES